MSDVQSETRAFGLVKTLLVNDNIASRVVDVLVNAANDRLHMGGGVAAALRSKACALPGRMVPGRSHYRSLAPVLEGSVLKPRCKPSSKPSSPPHPGSRSRSR